MHKEKTVRKIRENKMQNASYKKPLLIIMILFFILMKTVQQVYLLKFVQNNVISDY